MPERNHEVIIDGYVFPDTVTVTLANDEHVNSRDYVSKELYESICGANDAWQAENAKLRELVRDMNKAAHMLCEAWEGSCSKEAEGMSLHAVCPISDTSELCVFGKLYERARELGVGATDE